MGEDVDDGPKWFEIPADGQLALPELKSISDAEIEQIVIETVNAETARNRGLQRTPAKGLWRADFREMGSVYLKPFLQKSLYIENGQLSHNICAVDIDNAGRILGLAIAVRHPHAPGISEPPFVGVNRTKTDSQNKGLGTRRLLVLNEICKQVYGEPLASGPFFSTLPDNPEIRSWEHMTASGLALKTGPDSYQFK